MAWVDDDILVLGALTLVEQVQKAFTCKCEGKLMEYMESKIVINCDSMGLRAIKFMQPVLVYPCGGGQTV